MSRWAAEGERVNITCSSLISTLAGVYEDAMHAGAEFPVDVRLQVHTSDENDYTVHWGDPSFDTDHGPWGASTLDHDTILSDLALELALQAADMGGM